MPAALYYLQQYDQLQHFHSFTYVSQQQQQQHSYINLTSMPLSSGYPAAPVELSKTTTSGLFELLVPNAKCNGVRPFRSTVVFDSGNASARLLMTCVSAPYAQA
mmetsp:Transcript_22110/g.51975  ORF Transcript_22110/g.51975 Transcript_22110/m.51975 type:complete len:104 (+) Transcript_22110:2041-2352(+)